MTDQIPADEVRKIIAFYRDGASDRGGMILDALHALLPPPPSPTLEDMSPEERSACQWMQADVEGRFDRWVITRPFGGGGVEAVSESGQISWFPPRRVTPRPGLPRLEWPGTGQVGEEVTKVDYVSVAGGRTAYGPWTVARLRKKPAPVVPALPEGWRLADHKHYGRVVVTNTTPDEDGHVYFVAPAPEPLGNDWHPCDPDALTYLDTSEAVPPNTLAVGSVWVGVNALTRACEESGRDQITVIDADGYVSVWDNDAEWWEGSAPPRAAPYTILHAGKEADQ